MEDGNAKDLDIYLEPTSTLDSDHENIIESARALTSSCSGNQESPYSLKIFKRPGYWNGKRETVSRRRFF